MPCTFTSCIFQAPARPRPDGPTHDPDGPEHKRLSDHIRDRHIAVKYEHKRSDTHITFERKLSDAYNYVCLCGASHQTLKGMKKHVQGESTSGRKPCFKVLHISRTPQSTPEESYMLAIKKLRAQVRVITESLKEALAQQPSRTIVDRKKKSLAHKRKVMTVENQRRSK
ncbi:hypothetical protein EDD21DRAFT_378489 [Dissophora ornata]|nr:hypothetical protein EDD21DRAFT_378489 [Dissophora ornata]